MKYKGSGLLRSEMLPPSDISVGVISTGSHTMEGEMLQMRLLQTEEKYRSHFLYDQIQSFEDKVCRSYEQFNVDMLYRMFTALTKRTVVDVRKVKTISDLRKCFMDLKKLIRCKLRHRHVKTTTEEETLVNYFTWFFKYLAYLRVLRDNFVERIFTPLFRYFYNIGYDRPDRELSSSSDMSSPSVLSFRSMDSGYSGLSGLTSIIAEGDRLSVSHSASSGYNGTHEARRKIVTKQALTALGREFQDIRKLYDTSEIERLANRLSHLKDRTDHLLDIENTLDQELLCQDSERSVFHMKIANFGNEKIMRFIPDVLLKFQKEAWLARRWLEQDDETTKDLNKRLETLTKLESEMNRRLCSLSKEIQLKEHELETSIDLLNDLLKREDRSNELNQSVFDLRKKLGALTERLGVLNSERGQLCEKMTNAVQKDDRKSYRNLKPLYEKNKLQRFAVERQIATLRYHINLAESDVNIELGVKADVIHTTNDVQEKCEELEQRLDKAKKEQKAIQAALIPITEDRKFVKEQIQVIEGLPTDDNKPALKAQFIDSHNTDRLVDLNSEFLGNSTVGDAFSLFLTSRSQGRDGSHGTFMQKTDSFSEIKVPVPQSIEVMGSINSFQMPPAAPEVMASEW